MPDMTNKKLSLGSNKNWASLCVYFMSGAPKGSTESGSGEARDRTEDPWFTRRVCHPATPRQLYDKFDRLYFILNAVFLKIFALPFLKHNARNYV